MESEKKCDPGGCSSCGKEDGANGIRPKYPHSLKSLILFVKSRIEYSKVTSDWDLLFNEIGMRLAHDNAQAVKVLVNVFDARGPRVFLNLCEKLVAAHIEGPAICWTLQFAKNDSDEMVRLVLAGDQGLLQYLADYSRFHGSFSGNDGEVFQSSVENDTANHLSKSSLPSATPIEPSPGQRDNNASARHSLVIFSLLILLLAILAFILL